MSKHEGQLVEEFARGKDLNEFDTEEVKLLVRGLRRVVLSYRAMRVANPYVERGYASKEDYGMHVDIKMKCVQAAVESLKDLGGNVIDKAKEFEKYVSGQGLMIVNPGDVPDINNAGPAVGLPQYKCRKIVRAAKITEIKPWIDTTDPNSKAMAQLVFGEIHGTVDVEFAWVERFKPVAGGYFVVYEDGYTSFSPAKAFEEGYTKL
jgi:hypothetical protein